MGGSGAKETVHGTGVFIPLAYRVDHHRRRRSMHCGSVEEAAYGFELAQRRSLHMLEIREGMASESSLKGDVGHNNMSHTLLGSDSVRRWVPSICSAGGHTAPPARHSPAWSVPFSAPYVGGGPEVVAVVETEDQYAASGAASQSSSSMACQAFGSEGTTRMFRTNSGSPKCLRGSYGCGNNSSSSGCHAFPMSAARTQIDPQRERQRRFSEIAVPTSRSQQSWCLEGAAVEDQLWGSAKRPMAAEPCRVPETMCPYCHHVVPLQRSGGSLPTGATPPPPPPRPARQPASPPCAAAPAAGWAHQAPPAPPPRTQGHPGSAPPLATRGAAGPSPPPCGLAGGAVGPLCSRAFWPRQGSAVLVRTE